MSQNGLVNQNVGRNGNSKEHAEFSDKNEGAIGNWTKKSPMLHDKKKKPVFIHLVLIHVLRLCGRLYLKRVD